MASRRHTRRAFLGALGGLGVLGSAAAQTPVASPEVRARIPRLRVGTAELLDQYLPITSTTMDAMWFSSLVYDAPMRWNADGTAIPGLFSTTAASRSSAMVLQPRANTTFSDGTFLAPSHAAASFDAVMHSDHNWRTQHIEDWFELDDGTLRIEMKSADCSLTSSLCHPLFGMELHALGTGPLVPDGFAGSTASYRRNPGFWQIGRPHFDVLDVIHIPDDVQRSTAIATGEIDVLPNVPLLDVPMLANEPTLYLVGGPSNRLCHLQLKVTQTVLADARVRRILSGAIDRVRLVTTATAGQADPADSLFPPDSWTENVDEVLALSSERVRSELRDLGIPSDLRLHLLADNADATLANTAVVLQEQLANCGISLSITLLEGGELEDGIEAGDYDLLVSYSEPWRDPHELVWPLLASTGPLNWSGYDSVEVDTLLRAAIAVDDDVFRIARYSRLEGIVQKDVPCIPLFRPYVFDAVNAKFPGYATLPPATSRGLMTLLPADTA